MQQESSRAIVFRRVTPKKYSVNQTFNKIKLVNSGQAYIKFSYAISKDFKAITTHNPFSNPIYTNQKTTI